MHVCRVSGDMECVRLGDCKHRSRIGMLGLSDPDGMARLPGVCLGSSREWHRS